MLRELTEKPRYSWKPHTKHAQRPLKRYSSWRGGPLSLPPLAKLAFTVAMIALVLYFLFYVNSPGSGLIMIPFGTAFIWAIWRKTRIE